MRSLAESVLKFPGHSLKIFHTTGSVGSSSLRLSSPVVSTHFRKRIAARGALTLLNMEGTATTTAASRVGFAGAFTKTGGSFRL